jgi:hypothetical protein
LECVKGYFRQQDHFKEGELIFGRTGLFTFFFPQCDKKQQQRSFNALLPASNCEMEKRPNSISVKTKNRFVSFSVWSFCFVLVVVVKREKKNHFQNQELNIQIKIKIKVV